MNTTYSAVTSSPLGNIAILCQNNKLLSINIFTNATIKAAEDKFSQNIVDALAKYFLNPQHPFDFDFHIEGTLFQQKVWNALQKIPCGKKMTYGELAKKLNSSPRAVGQACKKNPIPIIIPCHRVVSMQGLGGYSGATSGKNIDIKSWLLTHEKA